MRCHGRCGLPSEASVYRRLRQPSSLWVVPTSRCARRFCSPLLCRIGVHRSAPPADRHPDDTESNNLMRFSPAAPACALTIVAVTADNPAPGSYSVLTFKVPNESKKGALTTQLNVVLPNVASASTEVIPGWTATLDRDVAAGTVRSATWTAAPGT